MAYHFLFPEKDTTIYSHPSRQDLNTGVGEILELTTEKGTNNELYYPSRILLQFKNSELTDVFSNKITGSFEANLKLYATEFAQNFPTSQNIELYPLSESWDNGNQKYNENDGDMGVNIFPKTENHTYSICLCLQRQKTILQIWKYY